MNTTFVTAPSCPAAQPFPRTAAIIPAYNEAGRVSTVVETVALARLVDELIVVTDGCSDGTASEVRAVIERLQSLVDENLIAGSGCRSLRLCELSQNIGKGGALTYGALRTDAEVLVFLDADLIGLKSGQVDDLLAPMLVEDLELRADMTLGLFGAVRGGIFGWWLGYCHRTMSALTGQRAIRRDVFLAVPDLTKSRFGVETAITRYVKYVWKLNVATAWIHNVTHPVKEEKIGLWRGFRLRMKMYRDIFAYLIVDYVRNNASSQHREQASQMRERFSNRL